MSAGISEHVRQKGETALRWLDEMPGSEGPLMRQQLAAVIQELATMRDDMILLQRAGRIDVEWLNRTNGMLSSIFGTEFPLNGLSLKRVEETRSALRQMLTDMNRR